MVAIEAVMGQIYLAVLVARLVGLHIGTPSEVRARIRPAGLRPKNGTIASHRRNIGVSQFRLREISIYSLPAT